MLFNKYRGLIFVVLTFVFTWCIEIPAALTPYSYSHIIIPKGWQTAATFAPGIIAIVLTLLAAGWPGVKILFRPLFNWQAGFVWYLTALGIGIALPGISILLFQVFFHTMPAPDTAVNILAYLLILIFFSPFWEELGWRGFLLPILQRRYSSFRSAWIIGVIWGLWHLPIILASRPYGDKTLHYFILIFIGCIALSILQTWLFNSTKSLLICVLLHDAVNSGAAYFYGNFEPNELGPFGIFTLLLCILAVAISLITATKLGDNLNKDLSILQSRTGN